jgi:hypothetical protein
MDCLILIKKLNGEQVGKNYSLNHLDGDAFYKNGMRTVLYNLLVEEEDELIDYAVSIDIQTFEVKNNV